MFTQSLKRLTLFIAFTVSLSPVLVSANSRAMPLPAVTIESVATTQWQDQLRALGDVSARNHIIITSHVNGFIDGLNIENGQNVSAGTQLIQLDSNLEQARVQEIKVQLKEDIRRLGELEQLYTKKAVSQSELEAQKSVVSRSEAQLQAAQATLSYYTLKAPFDGVLGIHDLSTGQYIRSGDPLVSLTNLENLTIDFMLPSRYISQISEGLNLELSFDAWPGQVFDAEIVMIDPVINTESRNMKIRAVVDNENKLLRPGLLASITLNLPSEEVMAIDTNSIFYRGAQAYVYVVNMNGQAIEQPVVTSAVNGEITLITGGLDAGDNIVTAGVGKISNGTQVAPSRVTADADQSTRMTEEVLL